MIISSQFDKTRSFGKQPLSSVCFHKNVSYPFAPIKKVKKSQICGGKKKKSLKDKLHFPTTMTVLPEILHQSITRFGWW